MGSMPCPSRFGLTVAVWIDELVHGINRFQRTASQMNTAMMAGAVGTHAAIGPKGPQLQAKDCRPGSAPWTHRRRVWAQYRKQHADLAKWVYLAHMRDRNEMLYFKCSPSICRTCCRWSTPHRRSGDPAVQSRVPPQPRGVPVPRPPPGCRNRPGEHQLAQMTSTYWSLPIPRASWALAIKASVGMGGEPTDPDAEHVARLDAPNGLDEMLGAGDVTVTFAHPSMTTR
jgi:hypothetical protein